MDRCTKLFINISIKITIKMIFIIHSIQRIPSDGNQTKTAVCWLPGWLSIFHSPCSAWFISQAACAACTRHLAAAQTAACRVITLNEEPSGNSHTQWNFSTMMLLDFTNHKPLLNYVAVNNWGTNCDIHRNVRVTRLLLRWSVLQTFLDAVYSCSVSSGDISQIDHDTNIRRLGFLLRGAEPRTFKHGDLMQSQSVVCHWVETSHSIITAELIN